MSALGQKHTFCDAEAITSENEFPLSARSGHSVMYSITLVGTRKEPPPSQHVPQQNYSGARAVRNGMLEICIVPENG
jgi:hypothetical protein